MRIAVLSDIHANLEALDAVVAEIGRQAPDLVLCLGDVVGYGPDPKACIAWAAKEAAAWVQGNHDMAALPEQRAFRARLRTDARLVLDWTETVLDDVGFAALRRLPGTVSGPWGLAAHADVGSVLNYVRSAEDAEFALLRAAMHGFPTLAELADVDLLWLGHTHAPLAVHAERDGKCVSLEEVSFAYGEAVALAPGQWLLNPGSVGQPRDGDPRARWAMLDADARSVVFHATPYDYPRTQAKMRAVGLPPGLIDMLGEETPGAGS